MRLIIFRLIFRIKIMAGQAVKTNRWLLTMNMDMTQWIEQLPAEWQSWLLENLQRGCSPQDLAKVLHDNGFSSESLQAKSRLLQPETLPLQDFSLAHLVKNAANFFELVGQRIRLVTHLESPASFYFEDVLALEECDRLIALSEQEGKLKRSTVVDNQDGSQLVDQRRSSDSTHFQRGENELVALIEQRISALLQWPVSHGEGLQILRYQQGGEYRPHMDFFDPKYQGSAKHLAIGGQRVATFILYLSDVEAGGGTRFPHLGLEFRPKKGAALLFSNTDQHGQPHQLSLHAGMPVVAGAKYIATKWLREQEYGKS